LVVWASVERTASAECLKKGSWNLFRNFFSQLWAIRAAPTCNRDTKIMKNASNPRRGRGRNTGKRNQNFRGSGVDGGVNDGKIRGSAQQVLDKYLTLARDASSAGDRIAAEGFFQHAEHYQRVLNPEGEKPSNQQNHNRNNNEYNKGQAQSQSQHQSDKAIIKVSEVGVTQVEQVEDMIKETSAEAVVTEAGFVEEKPHRRARPRKDKPEVTGDEDSKSSETTA
jgi:hypothetical protein